MSHFTTLIKTEYFKRKNSYWLPVWVIAGIATLILIMALTALIANWSDINIHFGPFSFMDYGDLQDGVKIAVYSFMMSAAFIFGLFMVVNAENSLSKEKQLGCELFYRCQPVNIWTCTIAKYLMHIYSGIILLFGIGLIFALVVSIVSAFTFGGFYPGYAMKGVLLGSVMYVKICLVFGSLYFFFSSVFKNNAFIKGTVLLGIIELVFFIIETLFRNTISLPNIFTNLFAMLGDLNVEGELTMRYMIADYRLLIALLFAGACYAGATLIYRYKTTEA
jgi:hypothetical protein